MLNLRLAGDHLYGKLLVLELLAVAAGVYDSFFFVLSVFPWDVLDEIFDLFESVSEGFPTYSHSVKSSISYQKQPCHLSPNFMWSLRRPGEQKPICRLCPYMVKFSPQEQADQCP